MNSEIATTTQMVSTTFGFFSDIMDASWPIMYLFFGIFIFAVGTRIMFGAWRKGINKVTK